MLKILRKKNGEKSKKRREDEIGDKIGEADIRVRSGSRNEKEEAEKKEIRQDKKKTKRRINKGSSKRKPASAKRWLGWK